jgi:hypothetical protein
MAPIALHIARSQPADASARVIPIEIHIRLVVYDIEAAAGLRAAAPKLLDAAERSADAGAADYFHRAYFCVLAVADAYERLQSVCLDNEVEAAQALPALCANLSRLIGNPLEDAFPQLALLSPATRVGELMNEAVAQRGPDAPLQVFLQQDEEGGVQSAVNAQSASEAVEATLASLWRRLRRGFEQLLRPAGEIAGPAGQSSELKMPLGEFTPPGRDRARA